MARSDTPLIVTASDAVPRGSSVIPVPHLPAVDTATQSDADEVVLSIIENFAALNKQLLMVLQPTASYNKTISQSGPFTIAAHIRLGT